MERGSLDQRTDLGQYLPSVAGHAPAENLDATGARAHQAEQHADSRGLARTVGAEEPEPVTGRHLEVEAVHHGPAPVAFGQAVRVDRERHPGSRVTSTGLSC